MDENNMKISIIIPAYNVESYIERCISSILKQTYQNYEIIVINDGSTDNTLDILNKLCSCDKRIKVISIKNGGVSNARNIGLDTATGDIISFVDADDYIIENMIETMIRVFMQHKVQLVACSFLGNDKHPHGKQLYNRNGMLYETIDANLFKGYIWNKYFKADIIRKNNIRFRNDIHMCEDMLFCLEYIQNIENGWYIDSEMYQYVISNSSMTHNGFNIKRLSVLKAYETILNLQAFKDSNTLTEMIINRRVRNCLSIWFDAKKFANQNVLEQVEREIATIIHSKNTFIKSHHYSVKEKLMYFIVKLRINRNI